MLQPAEKGPRQHFGHLRHFQSTQHPRTPQTAFLLTTSVVPDNSHICVRIARRISFKSLLFRVKGAHLACRSQPRAPIACSLVRQAADCAVRTIGRRRIHRQPQIKSVHTKRTAFRSRHSLRTQDLCHSAVSGSEVHSSVGTGDLGLSSLADGHVEDVRCGMLDVLSACQGCVCVRGFELS